MAGTALLGDCTQAAPASLRLEDGQVVELDPTEVVTLGSRRDNTIALKGEGVSRYHAEMFYADGQWWVRDLVTRNGVWVDEQKIVGEHALSSGDALVIGRRVLSLEIRQQSSSERMLEVGREILADRRKRALACASSVAAVVAVAWLFSAPAEAGLQTCDGPPPPSQGLAEGCAELTAGRYAEARDVFRRVKERLPDSERRTARALEQVADRWASLDGEDGPRKFRWDRAEAMIEQCEGVALPADVRPWLTAQRRFLVLNRNGLETLAKAKGELALAEKRADAGDVDGALESYGLALSLYRQIPDDALFAAEAKAAADGLRRVAFDRLTGIVRHAMRGGDADWSALLDAIESCRSMASEAQDQLELRRLHAGCEQNRVDQRLYDQASALMQRGADSLRVVELMSQIRPESAVYTKARAHLEELQTGKLLTQAQELYASGAGEAAMRALTAVMASPNLASSELDRLADERERWSQVVASYERSWTLEAEGEANAELERLLQLEPTQGNFFNQSARERLRSLTRRQIERFKSAYSDGMRALQAGDLVLALESFDRLREDSGVSEAQLDRVRSSVDAFEARTKLLARSKRLLFQDERWTFPKLRRAFALLSAWLPKGPKRAEAATALRSVDARLSTRRPGDH